MKPILIVVAKEGKIELTEAELRGIVENAYEQGKADARYTYPTLPGNWSKTTSPTVRYLGTEEAMSRINITSP